MNRGWLCSVDRAGVAVPKRVEQVRRADASRTWVCEPCELHERQWLRGLRVVNGAQVVVVGDERVHAVDRDELLGDRVRGASGGRWATRGCR